MAVAVSGGADSAALLFLLRELRNELGIVLSVAHVNHKLRGPESDEDEHFVADLAARLELPFESTIAPITRGRFENSAKQGIEAAARHLRYQFFSELARRRNLNKVATAHTLDDQAETVLLRIVRGTGIRGLAGIHPRLRLDDLEGKDNFEKNPAENAPDSTPTTRPEVIRPLLSFARTELRDYLRDCGESWHEDSSNQDLSFLRNRVRQRLIPVLTEEFGTAALRHLAELAEIARAEEEMWSAEAQWSSPHSQSPSVSRTPSRKRKRSSTEPSASSLAAMLDPKPLLALPLAAQRRLVRTWLETNAPETAISFALIEDILALASGPAGKDLALPGALAARTLTTRTLLDTPNLENSHALPPGAGSAPFARRLVRRTRNSLALELQPANQHNYEYRLPVPGEILVAELGARACAQIVNVGAVSAPERGSLLDPAQTGQNLIIRNWRAGDRYWPAHTAKEKKVKELLADRHATGAQKKLWPVAVNQDGALVWLRGFAAPEAFRPRSAHAIWIREKPA